ncbi:MAG: 4Fe-4S double cluster binding domain-containing protein [Thermodesulfobacteriota bacterium]
MEKDDLRQLAFDLDADFFGVADLHPFRDYPVLPPGLLDPYQRAISLGVALARDVIDGLVDGPTPLYSHHYSTVNAHLDRVALQLTRAIQKKGRRALPIPASQTLDQEKWMGAISHKAVARIAGLGWQGKSLLLVNPVVGPRLRLVTIFTDLELPFDTPLANRCGKCEECVKACPAGAIKGKPFGQGYSDRSEAWDAQACTAKLINDFGRRPEVTPLICGLCIKACPFGRGHKEY